MQILTNSFEMKQCDTNTIQHFGVPSLVLMERAALAVVEEIKKREMNTSDTLVVCGLGNNGGDGLAVARLLQQKGCRVTVLMEERPDKMSTETKIQYVIAKKYHIPFIRTWEETREEYTTVIDAVFGIGLTREVKGLYLEWITGMNRLSCHKVSVDIASGVSADNGKIMGTAFRADLTVTFAYEKIGHVLYPGCSCSGEVIVREIGIDENSWLDQTPSCFAYGREDLDRLPKRRKYSNKGTYGKILIIAGKKNMAGAAAFSSKAALAAGCGLVKIFSVEENRTILQQLVPEAILETYQPQSEESCTILQKLHQAFEWADVLVIGPGIGTDSCAEMLVKEVFECWEKPLIADADALNILSRHLFWLKNHSGDVILTPHLGEMARLTQQPVSQIMDDFLTVAGNFSKEYNVICVQKDAITITATPEGVFYLNQTGNHGMATAGAGDVLTGVIAALIGQGMKPKEASPFGVMLHGLAGDLMAEKLGHYGMMASDIIEGIRRATHLAEEK